jgi:hypothetical protein
MTMKNSLRSTVAAVMLLAPVAATLIAQPAAAQQRAVVAAPSITQMALNSDAGISPGATLRVQVVGTRNATGGSMTLGSSGIRIPLRHQGAGSYTGSYVVRRADRIDPTELLTARLTFGNRTYSRQFNYPPAFQALAMGASRGPDRSDERRDDRRAARDEHSPDITDLLPGNGERVGERGRTRVGARLSDQGSGVDPRSVHLRLNGRDVTADARVSEDQVIYRADLDPGRYTAEVVVRDQAGNSTRKAWSFDVVPGMDRQSDRYERRDERRGDAGPLPLDVTSHTNNMVVDARGNLAIQGRTVPLATVRVQVDAAMMGMTQPVADQTVQADRNGYFSIGVSPRSLPIPGMRYDVRVTSTSGPQTAEERFTLIQRQG